MRSPRPGRREKVQELVPGRFARVVRTLSVEEDRLLADHALVEAEGAKPLAERAPVVPFALSLAIASEVAGRLVPARRLASIEEARASRWITPSGDGVVRLACEASAGSPEEGRVDVTLAADGERRPSFSASFSFEARGDAPHDVPALPGLAGARAGRLSPEAIYRERLFHGPSLRPIVARPVLAENGAEGELSAGPGPGRKAGARALVDPVTLDGVGQLLGLWGAERCLDLFPVGLDLLRLHGKRPPAGGRVHARVLVTGTPARLVQADALVTDGDAVWLELRGLRMGASPVSERAMDARRRPRLYLLAQRLRAPGLPTGAVCVTLSPEEAAGPLDVVARTWLTAEELAELRRQGDCAANFLATRIAAKDAARCWSARGGPEMAHPASFSLDARLAPVGFPGPAPCVAAAWVGGRVLAVAQARPVGLAVDAAGPAPGGERASFLLGGHRVAVLAGAGGLP